MYWKCKVWLRHAGEQRDSVVLLLLWERGAIPPAEGQGSMQSAKGTQQTFLLCWTQVLG